jgi:hypothetical protein
VQIHGNDMVAAGGLQHVCHKFCCDRSPALVLLVLTGVGEVGEYGGDTARRGSAAGVDEDKKLHNVVVHAMRLTRLDDEDYARSVSLVLRHYPGIHTILIAHTFADRDAAFVVGVLKDHDLGQLDAETFSHQFGELTMAVTGQQFDRVGSHFWLTCLVAGESNRVSW